jgi:hypothetical protein
MRLGERAASPVQEVNKKRTPGSSSSLVANQDSEPRTPTRTPIRTPDLLSLFGSGLLLCRELCRSPIPFHTRKTRSVHKRFACKSRCRSRDTQTRAGRGACPLGERAASPVQEVNKKRTPGSSASLVANQDSEPCTPTRTPTRTPESLSILARASGVRASRPRGAAANKHSGNCRGIRLTLTAPRSRGDGFDASARPMR